MNSIQASITNANADTGRFAYEGTSRHDPRGRIESVAFGVGLEQAAALSCGDTINVVDNGRLNSYAITEMDSSIYPNGVLIRAERKITRE